jgi:hypothetical protein
LTPEGPPWRMRGIPASLCDLHTAIGAPGVSMAADQFAECGTGGRYDGDRLRPGPGQPCAAAAAPVGLPPGRARAKLPPRNSETPAILGRLHPVIPAALCFPQVVRVRSRSRSWPSGVARRRCVLETVERVVTTPSDLLETFALYTLPAPNGLPKSDTGKHAMQTAGH